jgi:hypothetical protein
MTPEQCAIPKIASHHVEKCNKIKDDYFCNHIYTSRHVAYNFGCELPYAVTTQDRSASCDADNLDDCRR